MRNTAKARIIAYEKWQDLEDQRGEEIYDYIEAHPGETAYSLAVILDIPRTSLQKILEQFEKDGLIVFENVTHDNRAKRTVRVRLFEEHDHSALEDVPPVPATYVQKVLQKAGIDNASPEAIRTFGDFTAQYSLMLAMQSLEIARNAGRTNPSEDDLLQAYEGLRSK